MRELFIGEIYSNPKDRTTVRGLRAIIKPPLCLNPEVVERAVMNGTVNTDIGNEQGPFSQATLIGSTEDATTIYARLNDTEAYKEKPMIAIEALRDRVRELLYLAGEAGFSWDMGDSMPSRIVEPMAPISE